MKFKVGKKVLVGRVPSIMMWRNSKIDIGDNTRIGDFLRIDIYQNSDLTIGKECVIGELTKFTVGSDSSLTMGEKSRLTRGCILRSGNGHKLIVGSMVTVGEYTSIRGTDHNYKAKGVQILDQGSWSADIIIEDDVWIASRVMIIPGITIGSHSIVAASAVVTKSVPPNSVAKGIPAKSSPINRDK